MPVGALKAEASSGKVIYETDTEYQYARVIESPRGKRYLELNEGQAQHSVYDPTTVLTDDVWDGHLVLPFAGRTRPPRRVAILGNAAGTTSRAYERFFPRTRVDGVEIDPELSEIGRRYFDMNNPRLRLYHEDARPYLRRTDARYDVISADAYRQPYIPFYLTTREFFELARDRLAPDGVLVVNAGHPERQDGLEKVLSATMGEVFPHVMRDPIEPTNTLIVASRRPLSVARLRTANVPAGLRRTALDASFRLAPRLRGGRVYTDDRGAGGVAHRQVDHRLRRRRQVTPVPAPSVQALHVPGPGGHRAAPVEPEPVGRLGRRRSPAGRHLGADHALALAPVAARQHRAVGVDDRGSALEVAAVADRQGR